MIANYHTHTRWCRHGEGEIEDYIQEGIKKGLSELAITEHVPYQDDFDKRRMLWEEFPVFDAELSRLMKAYEGKICIRKGFECEYVPEQMDVYRRFREEYGYEIMILGQHLSTDRKIDYFAGKGEEVLKRYADEVIEGLQTGFFTFLAHPDVALCGYRGDRAFALSQLDRIFAACEALSVPVEINANGQRSHRSYPDWEVWERSKRFRLCYLINSDAHYVPDLCDEAGVGEAEKRAAALDIQITERLPRFQIKQR